MHLDSFSTVLLQPHVFYLSVGFVRHTAYKSCNGALVAV